MADVGEGASSTSSENIECISLEKISSIIRDIGRFLADEKIYKEEQIAEVFKLQPSDSFVKNISSLLLKFKRKKSQDKFLKEFYGTTNANWKEYFHPYNDKKIVFLMLIHLPERLIGLLEHGGQEISESEVYIYKYFLS